VAGTEECDDGNTDADDGCGPTCRFEVCGDGIVQANEDCDDGADGDDADGCTDRCEAERCGDGDLDAGEECDDGNDVGFDGCSAACIVEYCGDGAVNLQIRPTALRFEWLATECMGPAETTLFVNGVPVGTSQPSYNGCFSDCGDSSETFATSDPAALALLRADGADVFGFLKRSYLAWAVVVVRYSDGRERETILADFSGGAASRRSDFCEGADGADVFDVLTATAEPQPIRDEQCDDGNNIDGDGCDTNCRVTACGNGVMTTGEQCDDGNRNDGDGCTAACRIEPCGDGLIHSREQCDDGNTTDGDGCDSNCRWTTCGNGIVTAGEQCDDGNTSSGDGCDALCAVEVFRAGDDRIVIERDVAQTVSLSLLVANDTAPNGAYIGSVFAPDNLRVELMDGADAVVATPAPGFIGTASFRYTLVAFDGTVTTALVTVEVVAERCGSGVIAGTEECDDGNTAGDDGCGPTCRIEFCGDGIVQANENCDDGANGDDADGCTDQCDADRCGDGDLDGTEECDDGNNVGLDGCSATCVIEFCGDGLVSPGARPTSIRVEWLATECNGPTEMTLYVNGEPVGTAPPSFNGCFDCGELPETFTTSNPAALALLRTDGADVFGFSKRSRLAWAVVVVRYSNGNERETIVADFSGGAASRFPDMCDQGSDGLSGGVLSAAADPFPLRGEECDDGNAVNGDGCDSNCRVTACSNGILTAGEQCDDGNTIDGDGCTAACRIEPCGDGLIHSREQCDDGNTTSGDGCDSNCRWTACGNGVVTAGEQCDDGNRDNDDGCDSFCVTERCGDGIVQRGIGEGCEDGNTESGDGCDANCTPTSCGNGIVTAGEECDDGNDANGDACDANCTAPRCGNGIVGDGEECDDLNTTDGDGCAADCVLEFCGDGIVNAARSQPVLIEFLWLASECGGESNVQFSLNGTQVADVPNGSRYCRCSPGVQFVSIEDPAVLALFRPGSVNEFGYRFVDEIGFAARTAWVIVQVHFDGWMQEDILVDESGGAGGRNGYLCGGFTEQVDQVFVVADVTSPAVVDECDDGNGDDGDGCSALCTVE
jgi:cysteine-rich repeat protein